MLNILIPSAASIRGSAVFSSSRGVSLAMANMPSSSSLPVSSNACKGGGAPLVLFDFDHTLIDCNSDTWVVEKLGAAQLMNSYSTLPWTSLMDRMMEELHKKGKTISDIKNSLCEVPLELEMSRAVRYAHSKGCELQIISDANSFFIETVLEHYGLTEYFSEIHTNPAEVDVQGMLHIHPYHPYTNPPHGCSLCPSNMCKGIIVDKITTKFRPLQRQIIYLGDGRGDYCPSLRLREGDHALARQGYPVWSLLQDSQIPVKAKIHGWKHAKDVEECFMNIINFDDE